MLAPKAEGHPAVAYHPDESGLYNYEIVQGFFRQSDATSGYPPVGELLEQSFGLLAKSDDKWATFRAAIHDLQAKAEPGIQYKVFFCQRHGQGAWNLARDKYGEERLIELEAIGDTDGEIVWGPDPKLTDQGRSEIARDAWQKHLKAGCPAPGAFFTSPLSRAIETMLIALDQVLEGRKPVVMEGLREIYGWRSCNKRVSKKEIAAMFPEVTFEQDFPEEDPLWLPGLENIETEEVRLHRMGTAMDTLFSKCPSTYIALSSHAKAIKSLMRVLGHRACRLETGEVLPLVVKATRTQG